MSRNLLFSSVILLILAPALATRAQVRRPAEAAELEESAEGDGSTEGPGSPSSDGGPLEGDEPAPPSESDGGSADGDVHEQADGHDVDGRSDPPGDADEDVAEGEFGVRAEVSLPDPAPRTAAASSIEIEIEGLREIPRRSAEQLLTLAPGLLLSQHSGEGHAPTIFLRGFDAGEGRDLEMWVDGIPINEPSNAHEHGYADPRFIIPELVRAVRVDQGPFDARQGDFAVAGTAEYRLGLERRGVTLRGEVGAFDSWRTVGLWGPEDANAGTFVGVDIRGGQGFGPQRSHLAASVLGRVETALSDELSVHVLGAIQAGRFDSAGVVPRSAFEAGSLPCGPERDEQFFCAIDPHQGGSTSRGLVGAGLEWRRGRERFRQLVFGGLRQLRIRENFTGALLDPRGDGLDQRYEAGTLGLRSAYQVGFPLFGREQRFEIGAHARHDRGDTRADRIRRELGVPYRSLFDAGLSLTNLALYALGEIEPHALFGVRLGLRVDSFHYAILERGLPERDRTGERLGEASREAFGVAVQPRGTVRVGFAPGVDWLTSVGLGSRSSDAVALSEGERAPFARAIASETGLALRLGDEAGVSVRAHGGLFHTHVDRDLLFDPETARNVPVGASHRYGAFLFGRLGVERWLDLAVSGAWTEARLPPEGAGFFDLDAGPRLPFVPRLMGRFDGATRHEIPIGSEALRVSGGIGLTWVGPRPLPGDEEGEGYATFDASLSVGFRFVEIGVLLMNLFDERYEQASFNYPSRFDPDAAASMTPTRHFAAGPPRTFFVTLTIHLEPARWLREAAQ